MPRTHDHKPIEDRHPVYLHTHQREILHHILEKGGPYRQELPQEPAMILNAKHFEFAPEQRCYFEEISLLSRRRQDVGDSPFRSPSSCITLLNCPELGMHRSFRCDRTDKSGEDIAGWHFTEMGRPNRSQAASQGIGPLTVLIINDLA